jgi:hypothetical protein
MEVADRLPRAGCPFFDDIQLVPCKTSISTDMLRDLPADVLDGPPDEPQPPLRSHSEAPLTTAPVRTESFHSVSDVVEFAPLRKFRQSVQRLMHTRKLGLSAPSPVLPAATKETLQLHLEPEDQANFGLFACVVGRFFVFYLRTKSCRSAARTGAGAHGCAMGWGGRQLQDLSVVGAAAA